MIRRVPPWFVAAIILIPAAIGIGWWFYWPTYRRNHLPLAKASLEKLLKDAKVHEEPRQEAHVQLLYARVLRRLGRSNDAWSPLQAAVQGGLPEPEGRREYALLEA